MTTGGLRRLAGLVRVGRGLDTQAVLVQLIRDVLGGFDDDHVLYLVQHRVDLWGLIPSPLQSSAIAWLLPKARTMAGAQAEEVRQALREARPGLADLADSEAGVAWLLPVFQDIPTFLKFLV